ncbi:MAG: GNAT family N-acetyltransferase [Candidatus Saccharimonadales bacterium]
MSNPEVQVRFLQSYDSQEAAAIGALMPNLYAEDKGEPLPEDLFREIVESPDREQLVAEAHGRIVGSAILHYMVVGRDRKVYLDDFVCEASMQGRGVGYAMWQEIERYAANRGAAKIEWISRYDREKAHDFYHRQGATISETAFFKKYIN